MAKQVPTTPNKVPDPKPKTPEQLAQEKQQQEQVTQAQEQMRKAMSEVLAPVQASLVDLQGKYQVLSDASKAPVEPAPTQGEELNKLLETMNDDDKFDKLSNKQMIDVMSSAFDSALKANTVHVRESVLEGLKPDIEKIGNLEQVTMKIIAGLGVQQARSQHKDFDEHSEEISAVLKVYPGMDYNDAYLLAKSKKAGTVPPANHINTEKPGSSATVPSTTPSPTPMSADNMQIMAGRGKETSGETKHGVVAFRDFCEDAVEKVLSARD